MILLPGALDVRPASESPKVVEERVVREGKIITAAGVASGIDMALTLVALSAGRDVAESVQLGIECAPQPSFDTGSPRKARPEITSAALRVLQAVRP